MPAQDQVTTRIEASTGWHALKVGVIWQYRELLYFLGWRAVKVRYKQAAIGIGWAILQPVLTIAVFSVIFGLLVRLPSDGVPYPVFALTALIPWTFFSQSVTRMGSSLVAEAGLLTKVYFPRILIPIAAGATPLVDFALSFVLLIGLMAWYGITPTYYLITLPLFAMLAALTALSVGLWLAPLNVRFRDVGHALPFLVQIWMYASPVVYSSTLIPERWRPLYGLNPMVGVIEGFRWALLARATPDFRMIGVSVVTVAVALIGGSIYFKRMERTFADVV